MAITFINSTLAANTGSSVWNVKPHSSLEGGALFALTVGILSTARSVSTITDNVGNVYKKVVGSTGSVGSTGLAVKADLWYAANISSASTNIAVTMTAGQKSSGFVLIGQFRGVSTGTPFDVAGTSGPVGPDSTTHDVVNVTPSTANSLVVASALLGAPLGTVAAGPNFTLYNPNSTNRLMGEYWIQGALSPSSGPFTTSSATNRAGCVAIFNDTFGAGGGGGAGRLYLSRLSRLGVS